MSSITEYFSSEYFSSEYLSSQCLVLQTTNAISGQISHGTLLIIIAVLALMVLVLGFFLYQKMFSASQTDFGEQFRENESLKREKQNEPTTGERKPTLKRVSKSAETVSNAADEDVVDELRSEFSSQPTVDATGDLSVSTDDDFDDEDLGSD